MFAMGLIAGIFGIFAALSTMFLGGFASALGLDGSGVSGAGIAALLFSILGIVGAALVKTKPKLAGIFMIVSGVCGLIAVSYSYVLSAILFVVGGCMGLFAKNEQVGKSA